jgi:hypothetical protein
MNMIDEAYDRAYQAGREELHAGVDKLVRKTLRCAVVAFKVLHRIEWAAPWHPKRDRTGVA